MAIGGYLNINILYTKQYNFRDVINVVLDNIGKPTNISIYYPELDQTLEYTVVEQIFKDDQEIQSPITFTYENSSFNTSLIYTFCLNDSWQSNIISIPMEYVEGKESNTLEQEIYKHIDKMYKELSFVFAYCLHEHEIDIDDISESYIDELLELKPSLYFLPRGKGLEMRQGETFLDGMTKR